MAIAKKAGNERVAGDGKKLYTGLQNFIVKAINPSMDELNSIGVKAQQEPEYVGSNDNGNEKVRIDVWLANDDKKLTTKMSFWLENEVLTSKSGKTQYINSLGQTTYDTDPSVPNAPDFFVKEGVRPAFKGEQDFIEFIRQWANVPDGGEVVLETMNDIVKGNVKELRALVLDLASSGNGIKVLLGVKDGKYQAVYTKMFARPYQTSTTYWFKKLNDQYGQFKAEYNPTLEFQEYTGKIAKPDVEEDSTVAEGTGLPF